MFKMNFEVQGRFQFKKRKSDGSEIVSEWFDNLVLNQGLDAMANRGFVDGVAVGTSNIVPAETQVQLGNEVARTTTAQGTKQSSAVPVDENTWVHTVTTTYRFPLGVFNNVNLSEVGILTGAPVVLWNRALIKDSNGNPTTITVLADEILDVVCEVKAYIKIADTSGNFDLLNKTGGVIRNIQYIVRPSKINTSHNVGVSMSAMNSQAFNYAEGYKSASLVDVTGKIGGTAIATFRNNQGNYSVAPYVASSYKLKFTITAGVNDMNDPTGLNGLFIQGVLSSFQIVMNSAIIKNNTQHFLMEYELAWGRYSP